MSRLLKRLERLEVKNAMLSEVLEDLLDGIDNSALPRGAFYELRRDARKVLNGEENE